MNRIDEDLPDVFNLAAYLLLGNLERGNGDKVALCDCASRTSKADRDKTYTYSQLNSLVRRSASKLAKLGLERENRVGILLPNCVESIVVFLGAIWLGAVPVPINPACSLAEINYILQDSRIKVLLTSKTWQEELTPLSSAYLHHLLLVDGQQPLLSLLEDCAELTTCASTSPDEAAFWLYTSGSTGKPKGVIHAHQSALVCIKKYAEAVLGLND